MKDHKKIYWAAFGGLTIFTLLEIKVPDLGIAYAWKAWALTLLALLKAFLVAYFYMHLDGERAWLRFIAGIPLSAGLFASVLILESLNRAPGPSQWVLPTWAIPVILVIVFLILKGFIYIKDPGRHGQ